MPQVTKWKLLPLAFGLALIAAACGEPPHPKVDIGSGVSFLPEVADPLNDAGRFASVVTNADGRPVVAYFGFEVELKPGEVPVPRPVGAPTIPGVLLATVSDQAYWTKGAIAIEAQIPNVTIAFNPGFEPSVANLTPGNVTGLQMVADGDTYHAVWGSPAGVFYATGSLDPATTTQATISHVTGTASQGPSIAVVNGAPVIAFYTPTSGSVQVATPDGDRWSIDQIAKAERCDGCTTAVVATSGGPAVAYSDRGQGVSVATNDGENGWVSFDVSSAGGQGLSGAPTDAGLALSFYDGAQVTVASGPAGGPFDTRSGGELADGSASVEGARTAISVDGDGAIYAAWTDADEGVVFASSKGAQGDALQAIDTGVVTVDGSFPSLALTEDGSVAYLAWYSTEEEDVLVGGYGEFGDVAFAAPSPTPTAITTAPPPTTECSPVQNGTVAVVAEGISFTQGSCIQAPANQAFTIEFDNRDAATQHNIEVFKGSEPTGDTLFSGDLVDGPGQATYGIPPLDAGEHAFNCVVHPQMVGTIKVGGSGGGGGGGGSGGGGNGNSTTTVTAQGIAFDTSTIQLAAGQPNTIHFVNQDQGTQHNIAIYPSANDLANPLFRGDIITGPDEIDYTSDPLEAGEYYFQCDIHSTMNGTVTVS